MYLGRNLCHFDELFVVKTYYYFFYRQCEEIRGKYGKVKTTAEQLESGIPEKLSETHTGEPFLRYVNVFESGFRIRIDLIGIRIQHLF
jgi:hypothetical protein